MAEPWPPSSQREPAQTWKRRTTGLLCYVVGPLVLLVERQDQRIRFHAVQGLLLALTLGVVNLSLSIMTAAALRHHWELGVRLERVVGWVHWGEWVGWLALLGVGWGLRERRVPWIGEAARRLARLDRTP